MPSLPILRPLNTSSSAVLSLVTSKRERNIILDQAKALLGTETVDMWMPASFLERAKLDFVLSPDRYLASHKCDGTRYLLFSTSSTSTYFLSRNGSVYQCNAPTPCKLPLDTILDGELCILDPVASSTSSFCFLVFDVLVQSGVPRWHLPFVDRNTCLSSLNIPNDFSRPQNCLALDVMLVHKTQYSLQHFPGPLSRSFLLFFVFCFSFLS